jgi:hypothetical protein
MSVVDGSEGDCYENRSVVFVQSLFIYAGRTEWEELHQVIQQEGDGVLSDVENSVKIINKWI